MYTCKNIKASVIDCNLDCQKYVHINTVNVTDKTDEANVFLMIK